MYWPLPRQRERLAIANANRAQGNAALTTLSAYLYVEILSHGLFPLYERADEAGRQRQARRSHRRL